MYVKENPAIKKDQEVPLNIEPLFTARRVRVGETMNLRFKVLDAKTLHPKTGLKDFGVMTLLSSEGASAASGLPGQRTGFTKRRSPRKSPVRTTYSCMPVAGGEV